jgi:hypothetical protein
MDVPHSIEHPIEHHAAVHDHKCNRVGAAAAALEGLKQPVACAVVCLLVIECMQGSVVT